MYSNKSLAKTRAYREHNKVFYDWLAKETLKDYIKAIPKHS